jgi:hypothetical protein
MNWLKIPAQLSTTFKNQYPQGFPLLLSMRLSKAARLHVHLPIKEYRKEIEKVTEDDVLVTISAMNALLDPQTVDTGQKLLQVAGRMGNQDALLQLALLWKQKVIDLKEDEQHQNPSQWIHELSRLNHGPTHFYLAQRIEQRMEPKYRQKYIDHLIVAAESSDGVMSERTSAVANTLLGMYYSDGEDGMVPRDVGKAIYHLQKAIEKKDAKAMVLLGKMLLNPKYGMEVDEERGVKLIKEAAEKGDDMAQFEMGRMAMTGTTVVEKNIDYAIEYWKMSSAQENVMAMCELGIVACQGYHDDRWDIPKDVRFGRLLLTKVGRLYQYRREYRDWTRRALKVLNGIREEVVTVPIKGKKSPFM